MDLYDLYPDLVLEEVKHPQNQGKLNTADVTVSEGVASCGDVATIYVKLKLDEKSGAGSSDKPADLVLEKMTWEAEGCAISRAGLSLLSVAATGKKVSTLLGWTIADILPLFHLKQISPGREQCLLLGLRALQRALAQLSPQIKGTE